MTQKSKISPYCNYYVFVLGCLLCLAFTPAAVCRGEALVPASLTGQLRRRALGALKTMEDKVVVAATFTSSTTQRFLGDVDADGAAPPEESVAAEEEEVDAASKKDTKTKAAAKKTTKDDNSGEDDDESKKDTKTKAHAKETTKDDKPDVDDEKKEKEKKVPARENPKDKDDEPDVVDDEGKKDTKSKAPSDAPTTGDEEDPASAAPSGGGDDDESQTRGNTEPTEPAGDTFQETEAPTEADPTEGEDVTEKDGDTHSDFVAEDAKEKDGDPGHDPDLETDSNAEDGVIENSVVVPNIQNSGAQEDTGSQSTPEEGAGDDGNEESKPTQPSLPVAGAGEGGTEWYDEDESGFVKYVVGFFALVGFILYFKFCRGSSSNPGISMGSPAAAAHGKYRTVSSAEENDDGWGWDGGDVELAKGSHQSPAPGSREFSLKQRSPSMEKKFVQASPQNRGMKLNSMQHIQPPLQAHAQPQRITSFGTPTQPMQKKAPVRAKPKEDDIFASMGLAAQPKFQAGRSPPPSGGAPISGSSWGAPSNTTNSAAWADDDLDDLFDD